MKKSEYQKFQDFKRKHNLTDKQIANILTDYANTEDEYSASFFAAKYNISEHIFYKMKDYTIIFMLVEGYICQRIRDKSFRNQSGKNKSGNYTTANHHYKQLIEKRKEYIRSFPKEVIVLIAIEYAKGSALYDIAKDLGVSTYTVKNLLAFALKNHLVCETLYQSIKFRSNIYITNAPHYRGYTAEQLWNNSQ